MNKVAIGLKELGTIFANILVFAVAGWAMVLLTDKMVDLYPDISIFLKLGWVIGVIIIWINTARVNWVSWLFKTK